MDYVARVEVLQGNEYLNCSKLLVVEEIEPTNLANEELGAPLGKSPLLTAQNHLQHVSLQLLHHYKDSVGRLEHLLKLHDALVLDLLQDLHLAPQCSLLI